MARHSIVSPLRICALVAALFPLTGCVTNFGEHGSRGASLSQAMEASASGGGEVSSGSGSGETYTSVDTESGTAATVSSGGGGGGGGGGSVAMVRYENREYGWQMPVDVAYVVPLNGEIESLTRFTLTPIALEDEHNFAGLYVAGDIVRLQPGSLPAQAVNSAWMLETGVAYRYYFTPAHAFLSPYFSATAAYQLLGWHYRNAVTINGDTITSDGLDGMGAYVGLGLAIKRNSYVSVFAEAGFGGTLFVGNTYQGFNNDVFSDFGYFTVRAGLSLKF